MIKTLDEAGLDIIFRTARTYNGYTNHPVTEADLQAIWDLMKWGPTSANMQPARILWCRSLKAKDKLSELVSETNAAKIQAAPVTAILGMDMEFYENLPTLFPHADARSWFIGDDALIESGAFRNSTLQGAYLIIAARALGFDTGPMSGFDSVKVDEAFFAGTAVRSNFICTVGHGDAATVFDRLPRLDFSDANRVI
jgi:3-hydroxypropanoate dehydrogenase